MNKLQPSGNTMRSALAALIALVATTAAAETPDFDVSTSFDKAELEKLLKAEHSQTISNVYDKENSIQYTWNVEKQELCEGVDGKCAKDEL